MMIDEEALKRNGARLTMDFTISLSFDVACLVARSHNISRMLWNGTIYVLKPIPVKVNYEWRPE